VEVEAREVAGSRWLVGVGTSQREGQK